MCSGNVIPFQESKACSGKCKAGGCSAFVRVWVVAACDGMVALLQKMPNGEYDLVNEADGNGVFSSVEQFQQFLDTSTHQKAYDQVIIVGSRHDIAWVHASMPACAAGYIAAEIKYPLLMEWFREPIPMPHLTKAIANIMVS